jgi:N-methylhydantoinase A/oxoprolinase/acetone carboxylase beta subunit
VVDPSRIAEGYAGMEAAAAAMLEATRFPPERRAFTRSAALRYRRQAYELTVRLDDGPITRASLEAVAAAFHDKHRQTYGHADPAEPVQLVNLRLTEIGRMPRLDPAQMPDRAVLDAYRWVPDRLERADSLINTISARAHCHSDLDCRDTCCHCINNVCE